MLYSHESKIGFSWRHPKYICGQVSKDASFASYDAVGDVDAADVAASLVEITLVSQWIVQATRSYHNLTTSGNHIISLEYAATNYLLQAIHVNLKQNLLVILYKTCLSHMSKTDDNK